LFGPHYSVLACWSHGNQLQAQLKHDSTEKQNDRINSLRREVYLNAAEELAKANAQLGQLPQADPSKQNAGIALSGFFAASAKLQLVCHSDTAVIANELTTRYGEMLLRLLGKASAIYNLNTDIRILSDSYDRHNAEVERTLAEMKQLNESGNPNPVRFEALRASCQNAQQNSSQLADERSKVYELHKAALRGYLVAMLKEVRGVAPLQVRLTAAMRGELGLATDLAAFQARLQANLERMDASINALLQSLENG
jgi:hypothetical protein